MKKFARILAMTMAVLMISLAGTACSKTAPAAAGTTAAGTAAGTTAAAEFVVGFANNNDVYDYCAQFRDYLVKDTEAMGIKIMVTDAGGDTNVQNGQMDDFIVQEAKVVSAISNDLDGSVPALEAAKTAGLPYISFLTTVKGADDYDKFIYVGSKNYDAGKMQGEYLSKALPENAKIIYFTGQPNDQQYIDRKQGLVDALAGRTDVTILKEYNTDNTKDKGMSITEDVLIAYDSFDAIVCQNDDSALGVVEALKAAGKLDKVIVVGIDGSAGALASIKAGELDCSILQDAAAQAKAGAVIFGQIRDGVDPATIEDVYVPFQIITVENVDSFLK